MYTFVCPLYSFLLILCHLGFVEHALWRRKEDVEDSLGLKPGLECSRLFGVARKGRLGVKKDRDLCTMLRISKEGGEERRAEREGYGFGSNPDLALAEDRCRCQGLKFDSDWGLNSILQSQVLGSLSIIAGRE